MPTVASTLGITSLPQLITPSALIDYIRILVLGGSLSTLRECLVAIRERVLSTFFLTVSFGEDSAAYSWMMVWLSKQPTWRKARNIEITSRDLTFGEHDAYDDEASTSENWSRLSFLPSLGLTHTMWFKRRWMSVRRTQQPLPSYPGKFETLTIRIFAFDHSILFSLLLEAKTVYESFRKQAISVFTHGSGHGSNWRRLASCSKRPLESLILEPGVKENLLRDAKEFINSREWYHERGIPFRRGYLLHGVPGAGKTSLIQSIAGELCLDIYIISISKKGLDDSELSNLTSELPEKCIAIMEDIDAAFTRKLTRESTGGDDDNGGSASSSVYSPRDGVTLSGLLNAIDGIGAHEGRILFATTNKYEALDPALCRPGRMDKHIEFRHASRHQAAELFKSFYKPRKSSVQDENGATSGISMLCSDNAIDTVVEDEDSGGQSEKTITSEPRPEELAELALQFADALPEEEFSMAGLQGYLMLYKTQPHEAVKEFPRWVSDERLTRSKRMVQHNDTSGPSQ